MIEVRNVTKDYGVHRALTDLSFDVKKGEIVGLLGPNGAGKTTTMRIITGFLPATRGDVFVNGHEVHDDPVEVKRLIGYMPENIALYPEMRIRDYLEYCAGLKQIPKGKHKKAVDFAMEQVRLTDRSHFIIGRLSKGYRQRVGLAQAILHDPWVLILDEPMVGLDPIQIVEIRSLIKSLSGNRTVILSTHILSEVERSCGRVIILKNGEKYEDDTVDKVIERGSIEMERNNTIVRVMEDSEAAAGELRRMPGALNVQTDAEGNIFVESENGSDMRHEIIRYLSTKGYNVYEAKKNRVDLEEVFMHITSKGQDNV